MLFYQSDWSKIYKKCMNHHSAPWCEISNNWIENFLRYSEISWFYVDFNHSFGQGMLFYQPIDLIFERNRDFVIIHHPAKFHENRLRTFWDNRVTDRHTDRHTDTQTDRDRQIDRQMHVGYTLYVIIPPSVLCFYQSWYFLHFQSIKPVFIFLRLHPATYGRFFPRDVQI